MAVSPFTKSPGVGTFSVSNKSAETGGSALASPLIFSPRRRTGLELDLAPGPHSDPRRERPAKGRPHLEAPASGCRGVNGPVPRPLLMKEAGRLGAARKR